MEVLLWTYVLHVVHTVVYIGSSKLVSEWHKKYHVTLGWEDQIRFLALLENSTVAGMLELATRMIHRDWLVINIPDGFQMDTK
jgi:hypothetical protein